MKFDTVNTAIQKIAQLNKLGYIVTTAVKFEDEICLHFTLLKEHNKALDTLSDKQILNMLNDKQGLIVWGQRNTLNLSIHKGYKKFDDVSLDDEYSLNTELDDTGIDYTPSYKR